MTPEAIFEGNKKIAEFMGFEYNRPCLVTGKNLLSLNDCQYHSSWDWLMPAYDRIAGMIIHFAPFDYPVFFNIQPKWCKIFVISKREEKLLASCQAKTTIQAAFDTMVEFLESSHMNLPRQTE